MHQLNVLFLGPKSFISTLDELKTFLKFNSSNEKSNFKYDVILFHDDALKDKKYNEIIKNSKTLTVCASKKKRSIEDFNAILELPFTLKEINSVIENIAAKKKFSINSSIKIKDFTLNINDRKISRNNEFIEITEKEIELIKILLNSKIPVKKDKILNSVWKYSKDADTHTVETHIYRLRKKMKDKFNEQNFIINKKDGYTI